MASIAIQHDGKGRTRILLLLEPENIEKIRAGQPFFHQGRPEYGFPMSGVDLVVAECTPDNFMAAVKESGGTIGRYVDLRGEEANHTQKGT